MKNTLRITVVSISIFLLSGCGAATSNNSAPRPVGTPGFVLPSFPFPPNASVDYPIDITLIKNRGGETTFGYVDDRLRQVLSANGYEKTSYYGVNGGFVIVTAMEQFQPNGRSSTRGRFDEAPSSPSIFETEFWVNALKGKKGRYRVIAFMITDENIVDNDQTPTHRAGRQLITGGAKFLPAEMRPVAFTDQHRCLALIYEYGQNRKTGDIAYLRPGTLSASAHLRNLLASLRRG